MSKLNCEIVCRCRKEGLLKRIIVKGAIPKGDLYAVIITGSIYL